jgi:hypothetical protein
MMIFRLMVVVGATSQVRYSIYSQGASLVGCAFVLKRCCSIMSTAMLVTITNFAYCLAIQLTVAREKSGLNRH